MKSVEPEIVRWKARRVFGALTGVALKRLVRRLFTRRNPKCPKCGRETVSAGFSPMAYYFRCEPCDAAEVAQLRRETEHYFSTVTPEQFEADLKAAHFDEYNKIGRQIRPPNNQAVGSRDSEPAPNDKTP